MTHSEYWNYAPTYPASHSTTDQYYDGSGYLIGYVSDYDGDGVSDMEMVIENNADGQAVASTYTSTYGPMTYVYTGTTTYDAYGRLSTDSWVYAGDTSGSGESVCPVRVTRGMLRVPGVDDVRVLEAFSGEFEHFEQ